MKVDYGTIFKNELVMDIMKLVGTGVDMPTAKKGVELFDISKLRFDKIIIACDSDIDGKHIESLLLTLFYKLTPELIKQGHIYILKTPLYEIEYSGQSGKTFAYTDAEMLELTKNKKCKISRNKGLGEMDAQDFEQCLDPATRRLEKICLTKDKEASDMFSIFMDEGSALRKDYITEHSSEYADIDIE